MPPALVNEPPTYTVAPSVTNAHPVSLAWGRHGETEWSARTCARFARGTPPTAENEPPKNQPPAPSGATARTTPATFGKSGGEIPCTASIVTPPPLETPTQVKAPPKYSVLPDSAVANTCPFVTT